MKGSLNPTLDSLGATWAETIAALETQEERDEAAYFIEHDLRKGIGNGILWGMFLLLKANRCYLEKLPGRFNRELVNPMIENLRRIEARISLHDEMQEKALGQMEWCATSATKAADRMEAVVPKMQGVVQTAFDNIDSSGLTRKIEDSVMEGVVKPVAKVNDKCDQLQEKLGKRVPLLMNVLKWLTVGNFVVWALGADSGGSFYRDWQRYGAIYFHEEITPISLYHR
jgi:hypothetical protein